MTTFPVQGGCHCRAVRYTRLAPALIVQHCHCSRCRKISGQLFKSGAVIRSADLIIEPTGNLTNYYSSPSFPSQFCKTCGCFLFSYEESEPVFMYLAAATLDGGVHPGHASDKEAHIYVGSRAEWDRLTDGIPQYDTDGPDDIITGTQRDREAVSSE